MYAAVLSLLCVGTLAAQETVPLEATLRRGLNEPSVRVNRPAYIAVFEVLPGLGVQQLYPRIGSQATRAVEAGEYLISRPLMSDYRGTSGWSASRPYAQPMYVIDAAGNVRSYYYATRYATTGGYRPGRTLLLVAATQPLRLVSSPMAAQSWMQRVIGFQAISNSISAPSAMLESIVQAVAPPGIGEDDIVVDVLDTSEPSLADMNPYAGQVVSFYCSNSGYTYSMPAQFFMDAGMFQCPMRQQSTQPVPGVPPVSPNDTTAGTVKPTPVPPVIPVDPEQYKVPGRRRPPDGTRVGLDLGNTNALDINARTTVTFGGVAPITFDGNRRGGVNPATGAWVPATPSGQASDYGYGAGRFTPASGNNGRTATGGSTVHPSNGGSVANGSSVSAGTGGGNSAASVPGNAVAPGSAGDRHASRPIDP